MSTPAHFQGADDVAKLTAAPRRFPPRSGRYGSPAGQQSVSLEDSRELADSAWTITSRIGAGLICYTGLGWLLSLWIGHQAILMAVGAMIGLALSYVLIFSGLAKEHKRYTNRTNDSSS